MGVAATSSEGVLSGPALDFTRSGRRRLAMVC
jgi:hypothetical protein